MTQDRDQEQQEREQQEQEQQEREQQEREQQEQERREREEQSPLKTDRGSTTVADGIVAQVAGIAAQEVDGVQMGGSSSAVVGGFLQSVTGSSGGGSSTRGVTVEVGEIEAAIDLQMTVEYGKSIPQLSEAVRRNVINRVENLAGLLVNEVNIQIVDVQFREERPMLDEQEQLTEQAKRQEQQA